jgi:Skp family chaperone for outer membrane proteins
MKRFATVALSALLLTAGSLRAFAADTIGTVDYDKLVRSYHKAQLFNDDMKAQEAELEKTQAEYVKQIRETKTNQPNNPVAVDQLEKTLRGKLEAQVNEYRSRQESQAKALENEMNTAIQNVAHSKGLSVILAKQTVFLGGADITNDVLSRLNATPAASSTTTK